MRVHEPGKVADDRHLVNGVRYVTIPGSTSFEETCQDRSEILCDCGASYRTTDATNDRTAGAGDGISDDSASDPANDSATCASFRRRATRSKGR